MIYRRFFATNKISVILFWCFVLLGKFAFSQEKTPVKAASDTTIAAVPDTLIFRIERAQNAITQIDSHNKNGYNLTQIRTELPEIKTNISEIKEDLLGNSRIVEIKTLLSYQSILKEQQTQLAAWRETLSGYNTTLRQMSAQLISFSTDTLLQPAKNSTIPQLYTKQINNLHRKIQLSGQTTTHTLDSVGKLLAEVSTTYFEINDLQITVNEHLKTSGQTVLSKESPYLWSAPPVTTTTNVVKLFRTSYKGQNRILSYFLNDGWDNRLLLVLFGMAFFFWVFRNFKVIKKVPVNPKLTILKFNYISRVPWLCTLIIVLVITPFFEPTSPPTYIEAIQVVLILSLILFIRKRIPTAQFKFWLVMVALYTAISVTVVILNYGLILRSTLILLNLFSIYIGITFYKKLDRKIIAIKYLKPVIIIYVLLHILAILLNLFGRISLAKVFSQTAITSLIQVVSLAIFIRIISEALELQIRISSSSGGSFSRLNLGKVRKTFHKALFIAAIILWLLVLLINLNFSGTLFTLAEIFLNKHRSFGSISYTLGNILLFSLILYISVWLQKNVGVLLGEGGPTLMGKTEHKSSKLLLIRLIVILIGFFMAITASGVPIDKLTVVLGALSVGIGLGMQNIVNNFVSGIILIFEKPFQIGDFVEIADKKGKVLDIGIRASRMLTAQGSEVIVPNGDLLSGRLVNWTLTNSYLKTNFLLKVNIETDLNQLKTIIQEEVVKAENTIKNMPAEILFNAIGPDNIELRVEVWINNIYNEDSFKGKILEQLFTRIKAAGIKTM